MSALTGRTFEQSTLSYGNEANESKVRVLGMRSRALLPFSKISTPAYSGAGRGHQCRM